MQRDWYCYVGFLEEEHWEMVKMHVFCYGPRSRTLESVEEHVVSRSNVNERMSLVHHVVFGDKLNKTFRMSSIKALVAGTSPFPGGRTPLEDGPICSIL